MSCHQHPSKYCHTKTVKLMEETLTIESDDPDQTEKSLDVELSGEGVVPSLEIAPPTVEFGDTKLNTTKNLPVRLKSVGGWPLNISSIYLKSDTSSDFILDLLDNVPDGGVEIQPGSDIEIMLSYKPKTVGNDAGYLVLVSDDEYLGLMEAAINGMGVFSTLAAEPSTILFDDTRVLENSSKTVVISNDGTAEVTVEGLNFSQSIEDVASIADLGTLLPVTLCAADGKRDGCVESLNLEVTFTPQDEVLYNGRIDILTDDSDADIEIIATGSGVLPHILLDPVISEVDFGQIRVDDSQEYILTVKNTGGWDLELSDLEIVTPERESIFSINLMGTQTIEPEGQLEITITCDPADGTIPELHEASFEFTSNDDDYASMSIALSADIIDPTIIVTPDDSPHDFGQVLVGLSGEAASYTIRNNGVGVLEISNIELASGSSNSFSVQGLPSKSKRLSIELENFADTGDEFSFSVEYQPLTYEAHLGKLVIESNDFTNDNLEIDLAGEGIACAEETHLCESECVNDQDVAHCGANCSPCFEPANGYATCELEEIQTREGTLTQYMCGFECDPNYAPEDDACAPLTECCGDQCMDCTAINPIHSTPTCEEGLCGFECDFNYHEDQGLCVVNQSPDCCGESCVNCTLQAQSNEDAFCIEDQCEFHCMTGYADCNAAPGCETDISSEDDNCGECDYVCASNQPFHMTSLGCEDYECEYECDTGYLDCTAVDGCETNSVTNINNCGQCSFVCDDHAPSNAHATACVSSECQYICDNGYMDCIASDGNCETHTEIDEYNCGICDYACVSHNPPNMETKACEDGQCVYECEGTYGDCTASPGCESNLMTDLEHCDDCNYNCNDHTPAHSQATICNGGTCIFQCSSPWENCTGDAACETDLSSDPANCGSCFKNCDNYAPSNSHASGCNSGECQYDCDDGWGDCTTLAGCETSTSSNSNHCGACNYVCAQHAPANSHTTGCTQGECQFTCDTNYLDCTADAGCETYKLTDISHCGACNNNCSDSAPAHMHATGCASGQCQYACDSGWEDCDTSAGAPGCETNISSDVNNCGGCNTLCSTLEPPASHVKSCTGGQCIFECDDGYGDCGSGAGCETNTNVDMSNCGSCGTSCPDTEPPHMDAVGCTDGICSFICVSGWDDCTEELGCETDTSSTIDHCGDCNYDCDTYADAHTHATDCDNGNCEYACDTGYDDCTPDSGCETYIYNNADNCGACNYDCSASANTPFEMHTTGCDNYECSYVCNSDWGDCSIYSGGCETDLDVISNTCGTASRMYRNDGNSSINGDDGNDYTYDYSGHSGKWYKVEVIDTNSGLSMDQISVRFELEVPPGVDYDFEVWEGCDEKTGTVNSGGQGVDESVDVTWSDIIAFNNDKTIYVKIYFYSGNNCGSWSLHAEGNVHTRMEAMDSF